jgi:hypothetical protein
MQMNVSCSNHRCKHFGIFGCTLDDIDLDALGSCRQCDYEEG